MYAATRELGDVLILKLKGLIDGGPHVDDFQDQVKSAIGAGHAKFLIDLKGVSYMRSQGVGMLIAAYTSASNAGCEMQLMRPNARVLALLNIASVGMIMGIHETQDSALAGFGEQAKAQGGGAL